MNKNELINEISKALGFTQMKVARVLDSFIDVTTKALAKKDYVRLVGFGTFTAIKRKATTGRNPRTGAKLNIAASMHPKFRAGTQLKKSVNKK